MSTAAERAEIASRLARRAAELPDIYREPTRVRGHAPLVLSMVERPFGLREYQVHSVQHGAVRTPCPVTAVACALALARTPPAERVELLAYVREHVDTIL